MQKNELLPPGDYLVKVNLASRHVYQVAKETDLTYAKQLSKQQEVKIFLKREDQQPVFSFKLRGAYNKMANLSNEVLAKGVICASAGNHAQGVALAARELSSHRSNLRVKATIVMPITTPEIKISAVKQLGAEVILSGNSYSESHQYAIELVKNTGATFVHPFDDPDVIAGQGTIAAEILRQHPGRIDAVFVAIGGGGLVSGIGSYIKAITPDTKIIGVQMKDSNAMHQSYLKESIVTLNEVGLFSDGTAVKTVGQETFRLANKLIDDFVTVDTDQVCAAIKDIFIDTRAIVEPAGAMAVAGIKKYVSLKKHQKNQTFAAILCGANMNFDRLRFIAERAEVGENREALFAVTLSEREGNLRQLCQTISTLPGGNRNITEFRYRMTSEKIAHVLLGISTRTKDEINTFLNHFNTSGYETLNLTDNELAKDHLRHMIGGASAITSNERILSVQLPERAGMLLNFVSEINPKWNISLFHYRDQGADYARVLMGLQIDDADEDQYSAYLDAHKDNVKDETSNPAYRLFLRS